MTKSDPLGQPSTVAVCFRCHFSNPSTTTSARVHTLGSWWRVAGIQICKRKPVKLTLIKANFPIRTNVSAGVARSWNDSEASPSASPTRPKSPLKTWRSVTLSVPVILPYFGLGAQIYGKINTLSGISVPPQLAPHLTRYDKKSGEEVAVGICCCKCADSHR